MKVKKYVAATMPEVMLQIRKDLGSDAVLLNSKEIKHGGFLGFFKKTKVEVVAALDPAPGPAKTYKQIDGIRNGERLSEISVHKKESGNEVLKEIKQLKKMIELQTSKEKYNYPPNYQVVFQYLLDQEVDLDIAGQIITAVMRKHEEMELELPIDTLVNEVRMELIERLSQLTYHGITDEMKVVHFVGPTGVGKTTTLAKIAADCKLNNKKKVAFITADTYRIAAIDQLKTYAQILEIPIEVAYNSEDYKNAVTKFAAYDLILVDTAGRNFRDEKYVNELMSSLSASVEITTFLVLSLTAKPNDLSEIVDQFQHLKLKELIFTKIDETRQYGSVLNIAAQKQLGVAYITNGQDVPDDLERVSPEAIANYIMSEHTHD
ncbi:flagellar biosynthesis protein FlhF [Virgibacillus sp. C22-A2]|uniref:Flagellar biosynthesis protein FlhF n=1 Tax=Virgibacillus tibetensis TaxID=3042313 RepID=A0ABU6KBX2_9BACI|nr:flagellar biosynthesis protein FlhF [Virgibacillus sp. C22-A2]